MNHDVFLARRDELRRQRPELHDCAELNVYRALALPAVQPSTDPQAPYRCHVAERFLAHLGFDGSWKARAQVSHGVRRSLSAFFELLAAKGATIAIPDDVYPVYLQLAARAGVTVRPYAARVGLPPLDDTFDALLVCEPLKPWGSGLSADEGAALEAWVRERPTRLVLLDSAYATPPTAHARGLVERDVATLLCSMSKGWLLPDHVGLCLVTPAWSDDARRAFARLEKDETKLRIGFSALTAFSERPRDVQRLLADHARAFDTWARTRPELEVSAVVGYFATSTLSFEQLLEHGVLAVPSSVFGSSQPARGAGPGATGSVLSSLPRAR